MKARGEFQEQRARNRARQKVFDACKRAREGEEDVWVTVWSADHDTWVRVLLAPGDPGVAPYHDYACDAGHGAILMMRGDPSYFMLHGKEGRVYVPTGTMDSGVFAKKVMGLIAKAEHVHVR